MNLRHPMRRAIGALLLLPVLAAAGSSPVALPDTMAERTQACTACHGKQGRATNEGYFPRIAGKPAGYLYNQLLNFREGRRSNATMAYLVDFLSDDYLQQIARYFAALDLPYPPPQAQPAPPDELQRGQVLVLHGDPSRRLPACARCHGALMTGALPAVPGLLGLSRDYLVAQLGGWRTGQRHAKTPDCMAEVAQRLSPQDISALANWLAAQPVPADARPAVSVAQPLPLACGSLAP